MNAGVTIPVASWKQVLHTMSSPVQASTRDVLLSLLLERGDADAADLAETLNLSVQAVRRQLRSLAEAGLVEASPNVSGPGLSLIHI